MSHPIVSSRLLSAVTLGLTTILVIASGTAICAEAPPDTAGEEGVRSTTLFLIIFYTPETRIAGGAAAGYFFRKAAAHRPNSVSGAIYYTANSQIVIGLQSEIYSADATKLVKAKLGYQKYPYSFWGIGPETTDDMEEKYTPRSVSVELMAEREFLGYLLAGGIYRFWYHQITEADEGGLIASGEVPGSEGGYSSGLGLVATWDRRDNIYYTTQGGFVELLAIYYGSSIGSDYDYTMVDFDVRYFTPLFGTNSLGLWGVLRSTAGDPPFQDMPGLGGSFFLRGYPDNRCLDKVAVTLQAEFRTGYYWQFAFVGFGGLGAVADRLGEPPDSPLRYSAGLGTRFRLNDENFNVRIDFGGGGGSTGFYLVAGEAF